MVVVRAKSEVTQGTRSLFWDVILDELERYAPDVVPAVRHRLDESVVLDGWLHIDDVLALNELLLDRLGPEGFGVVWERAIVSAVMRPPFGPLVKLALTWSSRSPSAFLHWLPAAYTIANRGLGHLEVRPAGRGGIVSLCGVPASALHCRAYQLAFRHIFVGALAIAGWRADVAERVDGDVLVYDVQAFGRVAAESAT